VTAATGLISIRLQCPRIRSTDAQLAQLFTGFGALSVSGLFAVSFEPDKFGSPNARITTLRATVENSMTLVYDVSDGPGVDLDLLDSCAVYFKRSYTTRDHQSCRKIRPLGLNYGVYGVGDFRFHRLRSSLRELRPSNARQVLSQSIITNRPMSAVVGKMMRFSSAHPNLPGCSASMVEHFEAIPAISASPRIVCFARTWDPAQIDTFQELNEMRAGCVRSLRSEFGPAFIGGLAPSTVALRDFPDCVIDSSVLKKTRYLREMKSAEIGVATRGVHDSNGWRLAEYVAASRAIVTEHLRYDVPGSFAGGTNYLGFDTVDQCVSSVRRLVDDPDLRLSMMKANHEYYLRHVRPDAMVSRSLEVALGSQ
jgi:hypothetical protein